MGNIPEVIDLLHRYMGGDVIYGKLIFEVLGDILS
jgi:hypothetical protein